MIHKPSAIAAAFLLLISCGGDGPTAIDGATSGSLSFNYTGAGNGFYSATGAITAAARSGNPYTTTWAAGFEDPSDSSTNIGANIPKSSTTSDLVVIHLAPQSTGTFQIGSSCMASNCVYNDVTLSTGQSGNDLTVTYLCSLDSGAVTISALSSTNATGTFSGSGTCLTASFAVSPWVVTNGTFNVPLVTNGAGNIP